MTEPELFGSFEVSFNVGYNKYQISDFEIISEKKFNELPIETKSMLIEKGFYNIVVAHSYRFQTLENMQFYEA